MVVVVEEHFGDHPGRLDPRAVVATAADAQRWRAWALEHVLPHFGAYEDAMTTASRTLFHTRISPLLNLQRLSARQVVDDVARSDHPRRAISPPSPSRWTIRTGPRVRQALKEETCVATLP